MARDPERGDPLQEYLALYDEAAGQMFVELDGAIREAAPSSRSRSSTGC
jgi:hypothetical protein